MRAARRNICATGVRVGNARLIQPREGGGDLVDAEGGVELAHVKAVEVAVLIGDYEVEGLHGVPAQRIAACLHHDLAQRRAVAEVVQRDAAVAAGRRKHLRVRLHDTATAEEAAGSGGSMQRGRSALGPRLSLRGALPGTAKLRGSICQECLVQVHTPARDHGGGAMMWPWSTPG